MKRNRSHFSKNHIPWNKGTQVIVDTPCLVCGTPFIRPKSHNRRLCSRVCSGKWDTQKALVELTCYHCKKKFFRKKCKIRSAENSGVKRKFCSHKCYSKWLETPDSSAWRGGTSFEPYTKEFRVLREVVRQRDGYKCRLCKVPQIECFRKLDVHHIDYNKKNNELVNLISLCQKCNSHVNGNRKYWLKYFRKKMRLALRTNGRR